MRLPVSVPLQRAFAVLSWERAVPAFLPFGIASLFVFAALWSGVLAALPPFWHVFALCAGAIIPVMLLLRGGSRFRFPTRREALRRIEERSDLPSGSLDGAWANSFAGDETDPLWVASRERLVQLLGRPRAPLPRIDLKRADPFFLRFAGVLAVALALFVTRTPEGLRASLDPDLPPRPPVIVDAWIEPPAYTGLSPIVLRMDRNLGYLRVPEDSQLHIRLRGEDGRPVRGVLTYATESEGRRRIRASRDSAGSSVVMPLVEDGLLTVTARGDTDQMAFDIREDRAPQVKLTADPETATGAIRLSLETSDEYALQGGELVLTLLPGQKLSRDAPPAAREVLDNPERIALDGVAGAPGPRQAEVQSEEHPWAGLLVKAVVEVTDGRGQVGTSEPFAFTMPERTFYNPMSQAVIEERRKLAMAPNSFDRSAELLAALTLAPDLFDVEPSEHLMLKATAQALAAAKRRDVPDIIDSLWPLAIELEDDGLAYARAQLDAAEDALREALRNGADEAEIAQRIADLREAMNAYIAALAESGLAESEPNEGDMELGTADLEEMLRQMEELAQQGARDEAESLLAQLEALLQSMQLSQGGSSGQQQSGQGQSGQQGEGQPGEGNGGQGEGSAALSGTGDLIQKQRELADETFSARRGDRGSEGLGGEQDALADSLGDLRRGLGEESGDAAEAFDRAEQSMRDAARALENGDLGRAQRLQEDALDAMRSGGNELAQAMGEGEGNDPSGQGTTDPLGRAWSGEDGPRADDFGLYDPERIRALMAKIRERLEDPSLSEAERTYLESLLERF